jgi:hypothetical protein
MRRVGSSIRGGTELYAVGWLFGLGGGNAFGFGTRSGPESRRSSIEEVD